MSIRYTANMENQDFHRLYGDHAMVDLGIVASPAASVTVVVEGHVEISHVITVNCKKCPEREKRKEHQA